MDLSVEMWRMIIAYLCVCNTEIIFAKQISFHSFVHVYLCVWIDVKSIVENVYPKIKQANYDMLWLRRSLSYDEFIVDVYVWIYLCLSMHVSMQAWMYLCKDVKSVFYVLYFLDKKCAFSGFFF